MGIQRKDFVFHMLSDSEEEMIKAIENLVWDRYEERNINKEYDYKIVKVTIETEDVPSIDENLKHWCCEHCGIYDGIVPRCNKCEEEV